MKDKIIRKANTPFASATGMLLIVIFMAAMNYPADHQKAYSYLALGDSYTIGEKVSDQENFPSQVCHNLTLKGVSIKSPKIIAKTGWTTDELQSAIQKENTRVRYDFVTLLIGVNNQYRGRNANDYKSEFESLLKQAISFANNDPSHVIVLSIPDWGATPFANGRDREKIGREIDEFNGINKDLSYHFGVHYIDITPGTRKSAEDPAMVAEDGLHPSGKEYAIWAERVAAIIQRSI